MWEPLVLARLKRRRPSLRCGMSYDAIELSEVLSNQQVAISHVTCMSCDLISSMVTENVSTRGPTRSRKVGNSHSGVAACLRFATTVAF